MGTLSFELPATFSPAMLHDLEWSCVAGGPDNMPWPTEVEVAPGRLTLRRTAEDSGYLMVPTDLPGLGHLMGTTATLMERLLPYRLPIEQARGKVNQVRCQTADWQAGGLAVPDSFTQLLREATLAFGRAVTESAAERANQHAQNALALSYRAAHELVQSYVEQVFQIRHERSSVLDADLGVRLACRTPQGEEAAALLRTCNLVSIPLSWHTIEATEEQFHWQPHDDLLEWAVKQGLAVSGGPLVDFSSACLPHWLWKYEKDLSRLASLMCAYVEAVVRRYRGRIRRWQICTASNGANVLSLGEDELLWLTVRLAETARQVDPGIELAVGIAQPWGEYMAREECVHSPFIFADTLIRTGLNLSALDLELVMGVTPRGSYCRDLLETSRLLDLYALLGVPLRVTLGYPSASESDHQADPDLRVGSGHWRDGFSSPGQADWAAAFTTLAVAKPSVQGVQWVQWSDAEPHQFPHCGLVDASGGLKSALQPLQDLRAKHLR